MNCPVYIAETASHTVVWRCRNCDFSLRAQAGTELKRNCRGNKTRNLFNCRYRGDKVGDTTLKKGRCSSCPSEASVFECDLHEYAVPAGRGRVVDSGLVDCNDCQDFEDINGNA